LGGLPRISDEIRRSITAQSSPSDHQTIPTLRCYTHSSPIAERNRVLQSKLVWSTHPESYRLAHFAHHSLRLHIFIANGSMTVLRNSGYRACHHGHKSLISIYLEIVIIILSRNIKVYLVSFIHTAPFWWLTSYIIFISRNDYFRLNFTNNHE